jgi:hypothetical protein
LGYWERKAAVDALDGLRGSEEEDDENEEDEDFDDKGIDDNFELTIYPSRA